MPNSSRRGAMALLAASALALTAGAQTAQPPDTVILRSDSATLRALVWRPPGRGPFPTVLYNHGSGRNAADLARLGPYERQAPLLGPTFAKHGYVLFYLFRRGVGLSADQGASAIDLMERAQRTGGDSSRNAVQLQLLDGRELRDVRAAIAVLRTLPYVDAKRLAMAGHSFGGSVTVVAVAHDSTMRAAVTFGAVGYSWDRSPPLRQRLLAAVDSTHTPIFFIHAANDYSVAPGQVLSEEMARVGKPHQLKIYPVEGSTPDDGHDFVHRCVPTWEPDVFAFLDRWVKG